MENDGVPSPRHPCLILANLNTAIFDYIARQKVITHIFLWYLLEQTLSSLTSPKNLEILRDALPQKIRGRW